MAIATNEVKLIISAQDRASAAIKGLGKHVDALKGKLTLLGVAAAAAMGALAVASVKTAASFEKTMSESVALAGLLPEEVDKVTAALLKLAPAMGKSPQELAEAFYFASSSGLDTAEALAFVTEGAKAAAAGLGETKTIVDATTSVMNAYALSADQAGRVTDTLVATVRAGKGEPEELAAAIGKVIPAASLMGVSFEEVGASMAVMTRSGMDAQESATALRGVLMALLNPGAEAAGVLKAMGTSADEVRKAIKERGLAGVLIEMMEATGGNVEAIADLIPNVRALTGALATAASKPEEYAEVLDELKGALGITEEAFAEATNTFAFKSAQVGAAFGVLKIQIGTALLPVLKDLADWFVSHLPEIQRFIDQGINGFRKALQDNQQTLKDAAAGIAAVGKAMFEFGSWVISNKAALVTALVAIGAALMWASGPVGIAVGIVAIASAFGVLSGAAVGFGATIRAMVRDVSYDLDALHAKIVGIYSGISTMQGVGGGFGAAMLPQLKESLAGATAGIPQAGDLAHDIQRFGDLKKRLAGVSKAAGATTPALNGAAEAGALFGDYAEGAADGAAAAAGELSELEKGLIGLLNAFNVSGLSVDQYRYFLDMAVEAMDHFNLTGEQLTAGFRQSGLAAMDFANRIQQLTALDDLAERAQGATDAVNSLYDAFNNVFAKPSTEEAQQNLRIAQLRLKRAEAVETAGVNINKYEQGAIDSINKQIDAIQAEIDVRRAQQDVDKALLDLADKTLMSNQQQNAAVDMITTAMGSASSNAAIFADTLFWSTLALANWRDQLQTWVDSVTANGGRSQTSQEIYNALSDIGKRYVQIMAGAVPTFTKGGAMPYRSLAYSEDVIRRGEESAPNLQMHVTINGTTEEALVKFERLFNNLLRRAGYGGSSVSAGAFIPA